MPALLRRVGEHTAELRALSAALARQSGGGPPVEEVDALAVCAGLEQLLRRLPEEQGPAGRTDGAPPGALERSGWCLAALASLAGTDLLLSRREPWGPAALCELALEAARWPAVDSARERPTVGEERSDGDPHTRWCPRLRASAAGRGFELAALVAGLVGARAGRARAPRVEVLVSGGAVVRVEGPREPEPLVPEPPAAAVALLIPGAGLDATQAAARLHLPAGWLAEPGA